MNEGLIPRRYAKALYEVASERGQAEMLYDSMRALADAAVSHPELARTLANPYVGDADKRRLLETAAGLPAQAASGSTFADWMRVLVENHRTGMAADIARAYIDCYRAQRGIYPVRVTSAAPLGADESKRMRALIQSHIGPDATMEYEERVDPALIGGFAIDIASERLDASVRARLDNLRLNILKKQ
ncbi:MAG: ATP synthase F1 subunit delta [Muribaculaceae bacterium]|nr:ATP synthase F1 subunit delta [Muribaculaceae bacterium]MDE6540614.1 ATP synthase F1 subunit delta [Muribaculaceae bacterium]